MTPVEIRDAIIAEIRSNWTTTSIAWPNKDFDLSSVDAFIRPIVRMGNTEVGEVGESGVSLRYGVLMVSIFVKSNSGNRTGLGYANTIEGLFRRADISDVQFEEPYTNELGNDPNGFYHIMVNAPFWTFVGE